MIKKYIFVLLLLITITLSLTTRARAQETEKQNLQFTLSSDDGLSLYMGDKAKLNIGTDSECGLWRDGAEYASFGLEKQMSSCAKVVFNFDGHYQAKHEDHKWIFKFDHAPLYESIKKKVLKDIIYEKDTKGNDIEGNNSYVDWYKNLGSRVYYLGDIPIIEAYVGYKTPNHTIKAGRVKGIVGFEDNEVFWGDDGKFAPMQHWIARDLLSGIIYSFNKSALEVSVALLSGNNPIKGYAYYLDGIASPNIKGNTTPSTSARIKLNYTDLLEDKYDGFIYASYRRDITGSTWIDELGDGKRNDSVWAYGTTFEMKFNNEIFNSFKLFGQYTAYLSGLTENSSQNDGSAKFKDIMSKGYFVGAEVKLCDKLSIGAVYEEFDRFDFNIYKYYSYSTNNPYYNKKQRSKILNIRYFFTPAFSINGSYHIIDNPALFVSNILDFRTDDRYKLSLRLEF